jgi:DNA replication protein DnaC
LTPAEATATTPTSDDRYYETRACPHCGADFQAVGFAYGVNAETMTTLVSFPPQCCGECAVRIKAEEDQRERDREARVREAERARAWDLSDLGARLEEARIDALEVTPENEAAIVSVRLWLRGVEEGQTPNLVLHGVIGSGKSWIAAALFRELHVEDVPALWVALPLWLADVKRGFTDRAMRDKANLVLAAAKAAPVLFLDDLGKSHPGQDVSWVEDVLYELVETRYKRRLPTVVTTEHASAALEARVGRSVVSRLLDGAVLAGLKAPRHPWRRRAGA